MVEKSEVKTVWPRFYKTIQNQFQTIIKKVQTDNGGELLSLKYFFLENAIIHKTTMLYTQQNRRVEWKQHIFNVARAFLFQSGLPIFFFFFFG